MPGERLELEREHAAPGVEREAGPGDVRRWFASLRATPAAADRSMPILSVILREAEFMGYRREGSNPR